MTETSNANLPATAAATNGNGSHSQGPAPLTSDDMEEVLLELNRFEKSPTQNIPDLLERYLVYVAKTGSAAFPWPKLKALFRAKLENVIVDFSNVSPTENIPSVPNVDVFNFGAIRNKVFEQLDAFAGIPFTVQRLAELLTTPRRHYKRTDKFMRALEKNMLIVSTVEARANNNNDNDSESRNNYLMNGDYLNGSVDNTKPESSGDNDDKELPKSTEGQSQRDQLVVDEVDAEMIEAPPQTSSSQAPHTPADSEVIDDEMVSQEEEKEAKTVQEQSEPPVPMASEAPTDVTDPPKEEATKEATEVASTPPDRSEPVQRQVSEVPELTTPEAKRVRTTFGPVTREPSIFIDLPLEANNPPEEPVQEQPTPPGPVTRQEAIYIPGPSSEKESEEEPEKATEESSKEDNEKATEEETTPETTEEAPPPSTDTVAEIEEETEAKENS